ncbi:flagellar biosynthesis protein FlhF [Paenibacillus senegalensis]|uniref:flagellar biosynthesis protein FlhF n=1 Tax=Paenibacillus senegalensis TaxID=1465766 RepID=UPI0002883A89|nr:flagellar biosynthesis protein FlhF [Paenibacillus senegalensis]
MKVKRYVVDSMPEAMSKIRGDLGNDAVILNTKEIRQGGLWGWFGSKKIEVIAAADTVQATPPMPGNRGTAAFGTEGSLALQLSNSEPASRVNAFPVNHAQPAAKREASAPVPQKANSYPEAQQQQTALYDEIRQMKRLVQQLAEATQIEPEPSEAWLAIKTRLLAQDMKPELVEEIMEPLKEQEADQSEEEHSVRIKVEEKLISLLERPGSKAVEPDTQVVHLVGPTGVGKTTTIAKLAAEQVLKHKRKVGLITTDTYRISAVEQLKTYATILNVPLEVVFSPGDMEKAYEQLKDKDIIFVDTAGRNYRNEMYVSELNSLLKTKGKCETILVLGLTAKYKDMQVITSHFLNFKLDKVLFTKWDETESYGAVVNLISEFPLKLSYLTYGQNVPEDIEVANERKIVARLLGEAENG